MPATAKSWDQKLTEYTTPGAIIPGGVRLVPDVLTRVNISGYSRTGKTTLLQKLLGGYRVTFHSAMPLDDLIGGWALRDGKTVWIDGPVIRAMKEGAAFQVDEANNIPPECQTAFYAIMDDPAGYSLPSGERVEAQPGYCVITTMNPDPTCFPHPIYDRFDIYLKADKLSEGTRTALGPYADNAQAVISLGQPKLTWKRPPSVNAFLAANKMRKRGICAEKIVEVLGWEGIDVTDFLTATARASR